MLKKLMKHELRASARTMLPLFLLVLVSAALANFSSRVLLETEQSFLNFLGILLVTVFVLAICAMGLMAFVLMIVRFYKSLLQDEGYVMMTLPVSVHSHVWAKLLSSLIWYVGAAAVAALSLVILVFDIEFVNQVLRFFADLVDMLPKLDMSVLNAVFFALEMLIFILVGAAAGCLQFYAALSVGHSFANRKMLLSVVFFFGGQFVLQLIFGTLAGTVLSSPVMIDVMNWAEVDSIHILMCGLILAEGLLAALFYLITAHFLKNRLNLE